MKSHKSTKNEGKVNFIKHQTKPLVALRSREEKECKFWKRHLQRKKFDFSQRGFEVKFNIN